MSPCVYCIARSGSILFDLKLCINGSNSIISTLINHCVCFNRPLERLYLAGFCNISFHIYLRKLLLKRTLEFKVLINLHWSVYLCVRFESFIVIASAYHCKHSNQSLSIYKQELALLLVDCTVNLFCTCFYCNLTFSAFLFKQTCATEEHLLVCVGSLVLYYKMLVSHSVG